MQADFIPSQKDIFGANANGVLRNLFLDYKGALHLVGALIKRKQCIPFPLVQYVSRIFTALVEGTMVYCFKLERQYRLG